MRRRTGRRFRAAVIALLPLTAGLVCLLLTLGPAGNALGASATARTDALYNLLAYPKASFVWFPAFPKPHERVVLASTSTDATSPIVGFAWDLSEGGGFSVAGPLIETTFPTFAPRVVRLRVTDRNHLSDVVAQTIPMALPPPSVLVPFPLVRIVDIVKGSGIKIASLAIKAGAEARSTVTCRGRGCPVKSQSRVVPASATAAVWVRFRRFERFLRSGVVLEIRVSREGKIGSYTRLLVRRHRRPLRLDECLDPGGVRPIECPTS